ncbi:hypothetical protein [Williamsoniiplasma lucivorax]|uniref:Uncharacterized protein n=1 Tax=Williamsoniiplasma lucivorax TaxID=209274 RepID=A0A2S5RFN4_9MOLU|nr:hypothetical protein [Williamsoniiplasma lucivorax]PPE05945.1 hypothetical protein ELUCI_v1c02360 [Williamsoniiplasma lucivorax]
MQWKYYEYLKTLDYKYSQDDIKLAIDEIIIEFENKSKKWTNKTNLTHNDYWILNSVMKSEAYNKIEILSALDRIQKNKKKKIESANKNNNKYRI